MPPTNPSNGCIQRAGPGPIYGLPTTVGYIGHDITKDRKPAYSLAERLPLQSKPTGPGPSIKVEKYDRFGSTAAPAFSLYAQLKPPHSTLDTPGPGKYYPVLPADGPSFTLKSRLPLPGEKIIGPGPNAYQLPSSLRGTVDHFGQRLPISDKDCSPGPAKYNAVYPPKGPMFTFGTRPQPPSDNSVKPSPANYLPAYNTFRNPPMYSFGTKHSECVTVPLTDVDKYPDCDDE